MIDRFVPYKMRISQIKFSHPPACASAVSRRVCKRDTEPASGLSDEDTKHIPKDEIFSLTLIFVSSLHCHLDTSVLGKLKLADPACGLT